MLSISNSVTRLCAARVRVTVILLCSTNTARRLHARLTRLHALAPRGPYAYSRTGATQKNVYRRVRTVVGGRSTNRCGSLRVDDHSRQTRETIGFVETGEEAYTGIYEVSRVTNGTVLDDLAPRESRSCSSVAPSSSAALIVYSVMVNRLTTVHDFRIFVQRKTFLVSLDIYSTWCTQYSFDTNLSKINFITLRLNCIVFIFKSTKRWN